MEVCLLCVLKMESIKKFFVSHLNNTRSQVQLEAAVYEDNLHSFYMMLINFLLNM